MRKYTMNLYKFKKQNFFVEAMTHSAYAIYYKKNYDYERLEFLGDTILTTITCDFLFHKFPKATEGDLSKWRNILCSQDTYSQMALYLRLEEHILLAPNDKELIAHERLLCCIFESYWGAIYLDTSYQETKELFLDFFEEYDKIQGHFFEKSLQSYDPISTLQEYMLKSRGELPEYHIFEEMNLFSGFILIDKIKIEEKNFISKKKLMKSLAKKALVYVDKKSKPKK